MINLHLGHKINSHHQVAETQSLKSRHIVPGSSSDKLTALPIFSEATDRIARLTDSPVVMLTTISGSGFQISSVVGMEWLTSLSSTFNLQAELSDLEYFHTQTISQTSEFVVTNFQDDSQLSQSVLAQIHGMRSYLGLPLMTAAKDVLGTIAIFDFVPRQFSDRDRELLEIVSHWVASDFERKCLSQAQLNRSISDFHNRSLRGFDDSLAAAEYDRSMLDRVAMSSTSGGRFNSPSTEIGDLTEIADPQFQGEIKFKLLNHLAQQLRTPLTSVLGMASVLQQEIYGPLSRKQKDYLGIIHHSGQQLVTIVDEIAQLGGLERQQPKLTLKSVDLEMLCQLALQKLEPIAQKKQQLTILNLVGENVSLEKCERLWLLDKDKVRQIVYYLGLSLIHATASNYQISIQLTNVADGLQLQIVTTDPQVMLSNLHVVEPLEMLAAINNRSEDSGTIGSIESNISEDFHIRLGLSLSHNLARSHGGKIEVMANGRGYQLSLPLIVAGCR